jgi:non-specific serine/threonine protein kinase/serine/threonine-protein kinase
MNNLATLLVAQDKLAEAEPYSREALDGMRRALGDEHPDTLSFINNMGHVLNRLGKHADAIAVLTEGEAAARRVFTGPNRGALGSYLTKLGEARKGVGDFAAAEATLLEACALIREGFGDTHERTVKCSELLAGLYEAWHEADPGAGHDAQAAEWRAKLEPPATPPAASQPAG